MQQLHVQFPNVWVSKHTGPNGRPGLWESKRNKAGRPIFTRNSRIVRFVRAQVDEASPTLGAKMATLKPKRGLRRGQVGVKKAVYCEIGFILEQLMEQLIVSSPTSLPHKQPYATSSRTLSTSVCNMPNRLPRRGH